MKPILLSFLALAGLVLAGCATGPVPPTAPARAGLAALTKGLTPDEVRALWGEPTTTRPLAAGTDNAVVWVYRRQLKTSDFPVATTVEEVPYFDPLTGVYTPIHDPAYTLATSELTQTIELVFVDDRLSAWKRSLTEEKSFR